MEIPLSPGFYRACLDIQEFSGICSAKAFSVRLGFFQSEKAKITHNLGDGAIHGVVAVKVMHLKFDC